MQKMPSKPQNMVFASQLQNEFKNSRSTLRSVSVVRKNARKSKTQAFKEPVVVVTPSVRKRAQSSFTQHEYMSSQLPPIPLTQPTSRSKSSQRANLIEQPIIIRNIESSQLPPIPLTQPSSKPKSSQRANFNDKAFTIGNIESSQLPPIPLTQPSSRPKSNKRANFNEKAFTIGSTELSQLTPIPLTQPSSRSKSNKRANFNEKPITFRNIDPAEFVPLTLYPENLWSNFRVEIHKNRDLFLDCFNY